jgi:hypothetical protein
MRDCSLRTGSQFSLRAYSQASVTGKFFNKKNTFKAAADFLFPIFQRSVWTVYGAG